MRDNIAVVAAGFTGAQLDQGEPMDLEAIAAVPAPVDEGVVQNEVAVYVEHGRMVEQPWRITSLGAADWAMRQLAECDTRARQYGDEIALWTQVRDRIGRAGEWFEDRLKEWAVGERTPQRKTFPLAHGSVATREGKARIEVVDEDAAIVWAKSTCPDAVKTTEKFMVSEACASIVECVIAFTATDKATGEVERIPLKDGPAPLDADRVAALREKMGDGYVVEPETQLYVLDGVGLPVPGLGVKLGSITATVTPLGL